MAIDPERWRRIDDVFAAAAARPAAERPALLDDACRGDDELRREVESLLAQSDSRDTFLARPVAGDSHVLTTAPPPGSLAGTSFGAFEVRTLVGVGGMGEVYLARDTRLDRDVALKLLPEALTSDASRRARLAREARMLATFSHPHIAAIHGLEEVDGRLALVLEYVSGDTLEDGLRKGPLRIADTVEIARQIAEALDTAHEKGIVHRDLKPANIKVARDGRVKVLDFGLAKVTAGDDPGPDLSSRTGATQPGMIVGSPRYMSPEQARGQAVDKRTDIWAFGCVLYEMVTGRVAFTGATIADTIAAVLERDPDWAAVPASTPAGLQRLVRRCLEKDPARRLRDIGDVRIELEDLSSSSGGTEPVAPSRRAGYRPLAIGGVLAAGAAGALFFYVPTSAPTPSAELPLADAHFVQLTDFPGDEAEGMISRDGRFVAFLSDRAGPTDLWLTQPGTGRFVNLTPGPEDDRARDRASGIDNHGFTGDGSGVWAVAGLSRPMQIFPLLGGPPKPFMDERVNSVAWSPDGSAVVYSTIDPGDPIFVAQSNGDAPRQIHVSTPGLHNHGPSWSLDGKWIYFLHGRAITFDLNIWRVPAAGGTAERVINQVGGVTSVAPIGQSTLLFTGRSPDFSGPWLWMADLKTGSVRRVSSGIERYTSVSASGDGGLVVAAVADPIEKLWTVPLRDTGIRTEDEREYATPTVRAVSPRFTRTGLFYVGGSAGGWLLSLNDGVPTEVWRDVGTSLVEAPAVSRDGRRIAVVVGREGRRRLAVMSAQGTGFRQLAESLDVLGPVDWSPDGSTIVAGGIVAGVGQGLYKVGVDGADTLVKLADGGAVGPIWSPTEDLIVYLGPNVAGHAALRAVRADGTAVPLPAVTAVFPGSSGLKDPYPRFTPDGRTVVFVQSGTTYVKRDFWALDLVAGTTRRLSHFTSNHSIGGFDISPDGRSLIYGRANDNGNLVLIDLRRGAAATP